MKADGVVDHGLDKLAEQRLWRKGMGARREAARWLQGFASDLRIIWLRLSKPGVHIGFDSHVGPGCTFFCGRGATIRLCGVSLARGVTLDAAPGAALTVAADFIGPGVIIAAHERITIGERCQVADMVTIRDHNHVHSADQSLRALEFDVRPIVVGDNVWLGSKATLTAGVTVGDNALVAAGAVVTRDVPSGTRVGGVPARPL